jgi:MraZ protein
MPLPQRNLVVLPVSAVAKMQDKAEGISIGEYKRLDVLRVIARRAHTTRCDNQGRIDLTDELLEHAGIKREAVVVGMLNRFEIWSPQRLEAVDRKSMRNFAEAAKQAGL